MEKKINVNKDHKKQKLFLNYVRLESVGEYEIRLECLFPGLMQTVSLVMMEVQDESPCEVDKSPA